MAGLLHRRHSLNLMLLRVASVLSECADDFGPCHDSTCCKTVGFGCFKRPDKAYAQCRPMPTPPSACTDDESWMCPGWHLCGERYDDCVQSRCCQSSQDTCYAKSDSYAQCLPKGSCAGKVGKDGATWLCTELMAVQQCSQNWQKCGSSRCCVTDGFHCYKHNDRYAQCMDKCEQTEDKLCKAHDKALSASAGAAPPSAAPPAICSSAMEECTHSRCCSKADFRCYQKGEHFAQCLRTGSCATRAGWESASCKELSHDTQCGSHAGAECTDSACCEAGLTCFMRDWGLARCMRGCSQNTLPDWSCVVRDRDKVGPPPPPPPSYRATRDFRCAGFRERSNNLKRRACAEVSIGECDDSYMMADGVYTPCSAYKGECAIGDPLKCDCELKGKDCPVAHAASSNAEGGEGGADEETVGVVELAAVTISVILVVLGCFAGVWMCCLRQTDESQMDDETELEAAPKHKGRRPNKKLSDENEEYDEGEYVE